MKRLTIERLVLPLLILSFFGMVAWKETIKISQVSGLQTELDNKLCDTAFTDSMTTYGIGKDTIRTDSLEAYIYLKASVSDIDTGYGYDTLATAALGITGTIDINGEYISGSSQRDSGESAWNDSILNHNEITEILGALDSLGDKLPRSAFDDSLDAHGQDLTDTVNSMKAIGFSTDSLVGYWSFDYDARDYSGNGNDGTVVGATHSTQPDSFHYGRGAYIFDGNDYISLPDDMCDTHNAGTVIANVFCSDTSKNNMVYCYSDTNSATDNHAYFRVNTGGALQFTAFSSGAAYVQYVTAKGLILENTKYEVGITNTGSKYRLYINGIEVAGTITEVVWTEGKWFNDITSAEASIIGALKKTSFSQHFSGIIDEFKIYDRALSASKMRNNYPNSAIYNLQLTKADKDSNDFRAINVSGEADINIIDVNRVDADTAVIDSANIRGLNVSEEINAVLVDADSADITAINITGFFNMADSSDTSGRPNGSMGFYNDSLRFRINGYWYTIPSDLFTP